ncbi:oligosaccharide flippase family protein [Halobaculum rubrum]|uniref:oligosaccharide flippase family protein n=1 Tax=Halobaculum rubrum TaxID=2872158 RepID=UPI001CA3E724|nr:oligosaccharide flippase family protein [Halobaculum rubrum]QZX99909.1 oligosaccharide flippase family protein [Halobaculum rubrum]
MSIARSGVGWMVARLGALGVTWLASLYFTRALVDPQATLGTYYAFETIVSFLVLLANGGLNGAIVKRVSEGEEPNAFATAGLLMSGALVLGVSLVALLASPWLIDFFGYGGLSVVFVVGSVVAYQVRDTLGALLTSNFNVGRSGVVEFVDATGQVSVQVGLIVAGFGAVALLSGYLVGSTLAALVAVGLVVWRFDFERPAKRHFRSLMEFARYSFANNFVQHFYDNIDIIVITVLLGKAATGVYGIGFRFSLILTIFYSAINRTSAPEISKHDAQDNEARIKEVLSDALVLGLLIGLPAFAGFVVLARPIIVTFYTGEFAAATLVAVVAVATRIPEGLRSSFGSVLSGMDRPDVGFRGGIILVATNLLLDVLLVPTVGVVGAIVASFVGMLLQCLYMGYHLAAILNLSVSDLPLKDVSREAVAAAFMAAIVYVMRMAVDPYSFVAILVLVGVGIITYFVTIFLVAPDIRSRLVAIFGDVAPTSV